MGAAVVAFCIGLISILGGIIFVPEEIIVQQKVPLETRKSTNVFEDPVEKRRLEEYKKRQLPDLSLEDVLHLVDDLVENFDASKYTPDEVGYTGEKNDENFKHGTGSLDSTNGDRYIGQWKRNLMHGIGKAIGADGSTYRGEFRFGNQHGKGMLTSNDGDKYFGEWAVGQQNGIGTYIWQKEGSKYTGSWANGDPHGTGTWENADVKYVGDWFKGKRDRRGKLTSKKTNEIIYEGVFRDGEPVES